MRRALSRQPQLPRRLRQLRPAAARGRCTPTASTSTRRTGGGWPAPAPRPRSARHRTSSWAAASSTWRRADDAGVKVGIGTDVGGGTSFSMLRTLAEAYKVAQLSGQTAVGHAGVLSRHAGRRKGARARRPHRELPPRAARPISSCSDPGRNAACRAPHAGRAHARGEALHPDDAGRRSHGAADLCDGTRYAGFALSNRARNPTQETSDIASL